MRRDSFTSWSLFFSLSLSRTKRVGWPALPVNPLIWLFVRALDWSFLLFGQVPPTIKYQTTERWPWLVLFKADTPWSDNVLCFLRELDELDELDEACFLSLPPPQSGGGIPRTTFSRTTFFFFEVVFAVFWQPRRPVSWLLVDEMSFSSTFLTFSLPTDGPPPNLLGAPYRTWKGFTPICPESTGMGWTATLYMISECSRNFWVYFWL